MKVQSNPLLYVIFLFGIITLSSCAKQPKFKRKQDIRGSKQFSNTNENINSSSFCESNLLSSNPNNTPLSVDDLCPIVGSEIQIQMNSGRTEKFFYDTDTSFPFNNFIIESVSYISGQAICLDNTQCSNGKDDLDFTVADPIVIEQQIDITSPDDNTTNNTSNLNGCPNEGINIISSKAPEDQPAHVFLSDKNQLFIIIFDDQTTPLKKKSILYKDLSTLDEGDNLQCLDIVVIDSDSNNCSVIVDCNVVTGDDDKQQAQLTFARITIPLLTDKTDIICDFGTPIIKKYVISDNASASYFYDCTNRAIDNIDTILVMYCPDDNSQATGGASQLAFFELDSITIISQDQISNCKNSEKDYLIQSLVTNPLYRIASSKLSEWQFALLLPDRICKCVKYPSYIQCASISLSNSNYHKMAYIEEEQVITLFVGSNESIDEIQVGSSWEDDGQNLIVGQLNIQQTDVVLKKIIVNQDYIIGQMLDTAPAAITDGTIVLKIFSRASEKSFMHVYVKKQPPIDYFQNDNFYDMGNYMMVYQPLLCTLDVSRITQKSLVVSTTIQAQQLSITDYTYMIKGNYLIYNQYSLIPSCIQKALFVKVVPFSKSVLQTLKTTNQNQSWQQELVSINIKSGVIGSLLYFLYEPQVQGDQFKSLIDYNQTISVEQKFFNEKTVFFIQINDSKKVNNPSNFRVVVSKNKSPCVVEQYLCAINLEDGIYSTNDSDCESMIAYDLTPFVTAQQKCIIDTYSEGGENAFIADKINLVAAVCSRLNSVIDEGCIEVIDDFVNGFSIDGVVQGFSQVVYFDDFSENSILVTVALDMKQMVMYELVKTKDIPIKLSSKKFLTVDKQKLNSLDANTIVQMDCVFLEDDLLFILTSDLKVYVLTRVQSIYQAASTVGSLKTDTLENTDMLVHVSAVVDLTEAHSDQSCLNSQHQQIFSLYGVDPSTISLVVLCYNDQFQLMQEFEFQNPFTYNWIRMFPFFDYKVESYAPHFTDLSLIYISASYQLKEGQMTVYLLFSILDYTPNSAVFEIITCYPSFTENSIYSQVCPPESDKNDKTSSPPFYGIPFANNYYDQTVSFALFFFNNSTIISYVNYYPQMYANADLSNIVTESLEINMIVSKLNIRDIHFTQYSLKFDLSDSQIQVQGDSFSQPLSLINSKSQEQVFWLSYELPVSSILGPIESYQINLLLDNNSPYVDDDVSVFNSYYTDFIVLDKYFASYQETKFNFGRVQAILNLQLFKFASSNDKNPCPDCTNLIAVISSNYFVLIEREQYSIDGKVSKSVSRMLHNPLQVATSKNFDGQCSMALYSSNQVLVYCVSSSKSTVFKLYSIEYSLLTGIGTTSEHVITSTSGYIGYVDQVIPFQLDQIFLVIKTHLILSQQTSIFKIATITCQTAACTLNIIQTISIPEMLNQDNLIVDYEIQTLQDSNTGEQRVLGVFISQSALTLLVFKYNPTAQDDEQLFDIAYSLYIDENQFQLFIGQDNSLSFIKLITLTSFDSFSFLLGTSLNYYEFTYTKPVLSLQYTFGKYYQCEHAQGVKPLVFNTSGVPLMKQTVYEINFSYLNQPLPASPIQSVLASCSRSSSTSRPIFIPYPFFPDQTTNNYYIQYFVKNSPKQQSWPVRILTFPFAPGLTPYVFEGFSNSAGESRLLVSNFSYFLVEHEVFYNFNVSLALSDQSVNQLNVVLTNGFSTQNILFHLNYDDVTQSSRNDLWFIVLIVIISVIALIAVVFVVIWIRKQRVNRQEKKKLPRFASSGLSETSDTKSEHPIDQLPSRIHPDPLRNYSVPQSTQYPPMIMGLNRLNNRNQSVLGGDPNELSKSDKFASRLSFQVDNLLRSVSLMRDARMSKQYENPHEVKLEEQTIIE